MFFLIFLLILLIFAGIPVIHHLEEKEIKEQDKDEKIITKIKQHTSWKKKILFILIGIIIFFFVNPSEMTLEMGLMKIMLILGIYIIDDFMKTKIYVSNKAMYVVEHIRNGSVIFAKMLQPGDIFLVEKNPLKKSHYKIGYFGQKSLATRVTFHSTDAFERAIFEKKLYDLTNKPLALNKQETPSTDSKTSIADRITKWFVWSMFGFTMIGVIKSFSNTYEHLSLFERLVTNVIAIWFIPFALYFFSFFFLKARKTIAQKGLPWKKMSISFIVASSTVAIIPFMKHEQIDGIRFLKVELVGSVCFLLVILIGWLCGKLATMITKQRQKKKDLSK